MINPQIYEQQIQGGIAQALGYALSEDFVVQEGRTLTENLSKYVIPTAVDVPDITSVPVQIYEAGGPFGLKGIGEIATNGPLPAVANAVADALGARIFEAPLTSERILGAILRQDKGAGRC